MRLTHGSLLVATFTLLVPAFVGAQGQGDSSRSIAGGGISVAGWTGKIDANASGQRPFIVVIVL